MTCWRDRDNSMKILFTDLDYTMLNNASHVSDVTRDTLRRFTEAGNKLVLSSGRPILSVKEVRECEDIAFEGMYIIANNGACVYDCDNDSIIMEKTVPFECIDRIWSYAGELGVHIQTYSDDHIITQKHDAEIDYYTKRIHLPVTYVSEPRGVLVKEPYKMLAISLTDKEVLHRLQAEVDDMYPDVLATAFSNDCYLEIFNKDAGKGVGLRFLADYLGVSIEDTYAAGDAMNDLSMIEAAGHGIAMCNGDEEVIKAARIVSKYDNDADGLAQVIEEYLL